MVVSIAGKPWAYLEQMELPFFKGSIPEQRNDGRRATKPSSGRHSERGQAACSGSTHAHLMSRMGSLERDGRLLHLIENVSGVC